MAIASHGFSDPSATARERLYGVLRERPAGADAYELFGLLVKGSASDPELAHRFVRALLAADPNFTFDRVSGLWSLKQNLHLKVPLDEARYVVVDLETMSGRPGAGAIIEIGAYRMDGRMIGDSFQSLVRPRGPIPRFITGLTAISNEMVREAPPIGEVLPRFRDFLGDAIMVAHNAQFDFSFLDFEFRRLFGIGLTNPVMCTIQLARRLLPSLKRRRLDLLAEHFGLSTAGRHRGLGDARMAAELLSIFIEMAARMDLNRVDRLIDYQQRGLSGRRIERHVPPERIAALPQTPGVYLMRNERGDLLYVGKARRLRDRVASYFNSGVGLKAKTAELVSHVWEIETRTAASALEAALLEARLIRELKPKFNRMLKAASPTYFVRVDLIDPFPRVMVANKLSARRGVMQLGPFIGRRSLDHAVRSLARILGLRICSGKLAPAADFSPCIYGQMGHCSAPCNESIAEDAYNERVRKAIAFIRGRTGPLLGELARARDQAAQAMRFEEAQRRHRELEALATFSDRASRLSRIVTENNLVIVTSAPPAVCPVDSYAASENGSMAAVPNEAPELDGAGRDHYGVRAFNFAHPMAYVVLSGRLARSIALDGPSAAHRLADFLAENYERYRLRAVTRDELEAMTIVARWLRERTPDDGRLIYVDGPSIDRDALLAAL